MTNILIDKITTSNHEILKYYVQHSSVVYSNLQLNTKKYRYRKPEELENAIVFLDNKDLITKSTIIKTN